METTSINDIKDIIPYYKKKLRKQKRIEESQINYILQESDGFVSQEPNSDLSSVQDDIQDYNTILNTLRREINEFTVSYFVPEFNMTLDELEMYQKDLSNRCDRLSEMAKKSPLTRNILEVRFVTHFYTNYDVDEVKKEYKELSEERDRVKRVLDDIYENVEFEPKYFEFVYDEDEEENSITIYGDPKSFGAIQKHLEDEGFDVVGAEFTYIPNDLKEVTDEQRETIDKMVERLEDFDDVQTVYTNMKP